VLKFKICKKGGEMGEDEFVPETGVRKKEIELSDARGRIMSAIYKGRELCGLLETTDSERRQMIEGELRGVVEEMAKHMTRELFIEEVDFAFREVLSRLSSKWNGEVFRSRAGIQSVFYSLRGEDLKWGVVSEIEKLAGTPGLNNGPLAKIANEMVELGYGAGLLKGMALEFDGWQSESPKEE